MYRMFEAIYSKKHTDVLNAERFANASIYLWFIRISEQMYFNIFIIHSRTILVLFRNGHNPFYNRLPHDEDTVYATDCRRKTRQHTHTFGPNNLYAQKYIYRSKSRINFEIFANVLHN